MKTTTRGPFLIEYGKRGLWFEASVYGEDGSLQGQTTNIFWRLCWERVGYIIRDAEIRRIVK